MITIEKVAIYQGDFSLTDVDLSIPSGEYAVLMGPTGCGKTTLVEAICGLRSISEGKIILDGNEVTKRPPSARNIGYVPQDGVLFPAMKVYQQVAFGLDVRKFDKSETSRRVEHLLQLLEIKEIEKRLPANLSGGEKQRVALARALAFAPKLLCLDEPLASLDAASRSRMMGLLQKVHQEEGITVLHITHSAEEAEELGSLAFEMKNGKVRGKS